MASAKVPKVKRRNVVSRSRSASGQTYYWTGGGEFWKRLEAMRASVALDLLEAVERGEVKVEGVKP